MREEEGRAKGSETLAPECFTVQEDVLGVFAGLPAEAAGDRLVRTRVN